MSSNMADAIRQVIQERGISEELVLKTIENSLIAAYKRRFGKFADNAVVKFADDLSEVFVYSRKTVVDGVYDPIKEIELEEALQLNPDCKEGDEIDISIDLTEFDRVAVQSGKQTAHQSLRDIQKDSLYAEYKYKVGEVIIGHYQRERNGNIFVDLGKSNVEGLLYKKNQSPRESYSQGDRIRALITDVKKSTNGLTVVLSRADPRFVSKILESEVPEVYDKTVEIHNVVREPGYRTKVAVYSSREDVDPVGACVGLKGVRIQNVIREIDGEKVDVLKYDSDPRVFIKNALSPAEVSSVIILDETKKQALAIVNESQFSLAIGKQGLNVRLANRLCDWCIDVKTEDQCDEIEALTAESRKAVDAVFGGSDKDENDISKLEDLPNADEKVVALLKENGIEQIEDYLYALEDGRINSIEGISEDDINKLQEIIETVIEIVEEEVPAEENASFDENDEEEETYECPECGAKITLDMTQCPNCGVELSFEYEDEE